ncbi:MAG: stage IV sporulation protein A [Oscillospiraceae bacterium]|nr:stage IV sporulation protein A [Oscillospiraceae bacterium]
MNQTASIYQDMAARTGSSIYIGVVGPVRTGKSTFIKRFMESQVLPNIDNVYRRDRARDELPQSGSGRTIMTAEPKFVPEEAVELQLEKGSSCYVRMIDCVGYMVPGAVGQYEDLSPRMVMTPWYDYEIPMVEAAEIGTRKVIAEHSTVGIVVTTDGTVTDIPREDYQEAEERVIRELQEIGKPFVVLVNSAQPAGARCRAIADEIERRYQVKCLCVNCLEMEEDEMLQLLRQLLYEFPLQELQLFFPPWVDALPAEHPIKSGLYSTVAEQSKKLCHIRDLEACLAQIKTDEHVGEIQIREMDLGVGIACVEVSVPRALFYATLSQQSGLQIGDDGDLLELLTQLSAMKKEYDKVAPALQEARESGYGIVMPCVEELDLEDPEIVRQGGRYGVRMKASAPSIHMIRADIATTVSPIVGNEKQSEDMVNYLLQEFEGDTSKIWQSNIFGRSFHEIVGDDLQAKLKRMPEDSRKKLREALERIINEGSGGLICIIL